MTWAKIDDGFLDHPKVLRAGEDAANLYLRGLIWCNKHLTDGAIPREALRALSMRRDTVALAGKLAGVGLWEVTAEGWFVHDFAAHNPLRAEVEAKRQDLSVKRAEAGKRGGMRSGEVRSAEANAKQLASPVASRLPKQNEAPSRPVPSAEDQSLPNGRLPQQPPEGATAATAADAKAGKRKTSKPDDPPPQPSTPAALAVTAVEGAGYLRGLVMRPNALALAAAAAFPAIDLPGEIAKANGWCVTNSAKAPRSNGDRFLWGWLQRAQNDLANRSARGDQRNDLFAPRAAPTVKVTRDTLASERQRLIDSTERKGA